MTFVASLYFDDFQEPENKKVLAEQHLGGFTISQWLGNMLNSPMESIAAYAACTLYAIDKYLNVSTHTPTRPVFFLPKLNTLQICFYLGGLGTYD